MTTIFDVLEKATTAVQRKRLAAQDRERAAFEAENPIQNKLPTKTPTTPKTITPKTTKPKTTKPKTTKPKAKKPKAKKTTTPKAKKPKAKKTKLKTPKGAVGSKVGETYSQSVQGVGRSVRNRSGGGGRSRGSGREEVVADPFGSRARIRTTPKKQQRKIKIKKAVCPLIKTELNNAFNNLLDQYQVLYKDYETDKFNEAEGKKKAPKITTDSRRGAHGGDTQAQPKAMGTTRADQAVMQS